MSTTRPHLLYIFMVIQIWDRALWAQFDFEILIARSFNNTKKCTSHHFLRRGQCSKTAFRFKHREAFNRDKKSVVGQFAKLVQILVVEWEGVQFRLINIKPPQIQRCASLQRRTTQWSEGNVWYWQKLLSRIFNIGRAGPMINMVVTHQRWNITRE